MAPDPNNPSPSPEDIFAEYLARLYAGEDPDLDELCASHPAAERELRELHEKWLEIRGVLDKLGVSGSLAMSLSVHHGDEVDPKVSLEPEGSADSVFASEVIGRLSSRSGAFGRYRLKGEVASGGQGAVLRVWDDDLRRHLAMKVMLGQGEIGESGETPNVDSRTLGRFLEEAQVTGQLDHPNIVPVHELGLDSEGRVYFTMKLVKGRELKEVFDLARDEEEGWTRTRALGVLLKVCEAMSYAHAKGVVHRDLKPGNVMVGRFGEVYVMDWGLARVLGEEDEKDIRVQPPMTTSGVHSERREGATPDSPLVTMDGEVVGTPAYMSPEQARGQQAEMGPHSDVYALGAMLYHLLAGHVPYVEPGMRLSNYGIWYQVQKGPPAPLTDRAADAPAELVAICEKAMERDADRRYRDTAELAEDLAAFLEHRVVAAYETGAVAEFKKWVQRNKALAALMLIATFLVVGVSLAASVVLAGKNRDLTVANEAADTATVAAESATATAERSALEARRERDNVLRLSAFQKLEDLQAEADALWPAHPVQIEDMRDWLERAQDLIDGLEPDPGADDPGHRAQLASLRARALPQTPEERDRESLPRVAELLALEARLEQEALSAQDDAAVQAVAELEAVVEALREEVDERHTFMFADAEDTWWHAQLAKLVAEIEAFADEEEGLVAGLSPPFGWGVARRLAFAEELRDGFAPGGEFEVRWGRDLPTIRAAYPGLVLPVQVGLVPIGADPDSGLWEFWHQATGEEPRRGADGKLELTEESGAVLVLLPGGAFWMGAQSSDPTDRNFDAQALSDESQVHELTLSPFFLSKYELTQGQWKRMTARNPSQFQGSLAPTLLHPVEQVRWPDCMEWLPRMELALPSEAQWEYGARAGTDTPWWTGAEQESLQEAHAVNLADQAALRGGAAWPTIKDWPELDDGSVAHAEVGTYAANAFGLREVHGNLCEWCLDGYDGGFYAVSPEMDPVAPWEGAAYRVFRGGGFNNDADGARSAFRNYINPSFAGDFLGVRPARSIEP